MEGNFKIDSALQIQARPSMMAPSGAPQSPAADHDHDAHASGSGVLPGFASSLDPLYRTIREATPPE